MYLIPRHCFNVKAEWGTSAAEKENLTYFNHSVKTCLFCITKKSHVEYYGTLSFQVSPLPDNKVHGASIGPTWVLSAPDRPHVGPMILAIRAMYVSSWLSANVPTPGSTTPSADTVCSYRATQILSEFVLALRDIESSWLSWWYHYIYIQKVDDISGNIVTHWMLIYIFGKYLIFCIPW